MITKKTMVSVEVDTERGKYRDNLYYPVDDVPSDEECEAIIQERADNWVYLLNNPPEPIEPTIEELQTQQQEYIRLVDELTTKIIEIGTTLEKEKMKAETTPQIDIISDKLEEI